MIPPDTGARAADWGGPAHGPAPAVRPDPWVRPTMIYSGESGRAMVRHMWALGLLSKPRPSFGCLKWRPMMSMNGSIETLAFGSNEYKSFTVTRRGSMYHLWFFNIL